MQIAPRQSDMLYSYHIHCRGLHLLVDNVGKQSVFFSFDTDVPMFFSICFEYV